MHFLLLGAAIFIAYGLVSTPRSGAPGTVVVSAGRVEHLAAGFAMLWQRPPTDAELKVLIDEWVREEIATREALALGLDKDDTVIRRRLRQKLEFVSDDIAAQTEPTDADLNAYLNAHPGSFGVEPRLTFRQVYLNPQQHRASIGRDTAQVLAKLKQGGDKTDGSTLGDSTLLPHTFQAVPVSEIAKQFGEPFAARLVGLPLGQWQGPVESAYGVHLVLVGERTHARLPELADVRNAVRLEWENARRLEGQADFYQELLKRYTVTFEGLEPVEEQKKLAETK